MVAVNFDQMVEGLDYRIVLGELVIGSAVYRKVDNKLYLDSLGEFYSGSIEGLTFVEESGSSK